MIPEAQNGITLTIQPSCPGGIGQRIRVLAAIEFDNQALLATNEIGNERTERHLPYKFVAVEVTTSQFPPKPVLSFGLFKS